MKSSEDRRAVHVPRVPLVTLVDICTQGEDPAPFQAESANLSGRGMHVRTSYLPNIGEELVCRLEHAGQEVLVEGRVAWRSEGEDSGEFGIQFTALDADSAEVIQALGEPKRESKRPPTTTAEDEDDDLGESETFVQGSRVKLHIDGLGAPMKACIHEGNHRKLRVGSCLEFLKVGRALQIEDVVGGEQRGAQVDSVNVVINPSTSIPELVVQLRYEGVSPTPAPVRVKSDKVSIDYDDEAFEATTSSSDSHGQSLDDPELDEDDAAPWEPAAEALRARLGGAAQKAGSMAQRAGGALSIMARSARQQMASVSFKGNGQSTAGKNGRSTAQAPQAKRRQTSRHTSRVAPSHLRSGIHDLGLAGRPRPVDSRSAKRAPAEEAKPRRRIAPALVFGAAFLLFGGSALALRMTGDEEAPVAVSAETAEKKSPAVAEKPKAAPQKVVTAKKKADESEDGVVAEVPLFGPQAMAVKPAEKPTVEVDLAEAEQRSAAAAVEDESWDEAPTETNVEDAKPWGRGRLYLPTIHRIRLDGVGASLAGAVNPDGFTVVVPGRKAMESGKAIEKRDKRIIQVSASNGARGATVKFEFRGSVPPYRVRLRKDFIEFLISAPEETVAQL